MNALPIIFALLVSPKVVGLQGAGKPANNKPVPLTMDVYQVKAGARTLIKANDTLTGEVTFRIVMQTQVPIQAVEFYLGDDLRDTDGSTPYEFKLDTLAEEDGNAKLRFKGFTAEGTNVEKVFTLKIDNGVGLGAAVHVDKGNELLTNGKYDEAITEGRIALRADKDSIPAKLLLARANFAKGILDVSQNFAEEVLTAEPKNRNAKEVVVSVKVKQAFSSASKSSTDRKDTISGIRNALSTAIDRRQEILTEDLEAAAAKEKGSIDFVDAAIRARRYALVVETLEKRVLSNYKDTESVNRLIFALLVTNRSAQAEPHFNNMKKFGTPNAYSYALLSVIEAEKGNDIASDAAIQEALLQNPESLGVKTAQAYIGLKRDRPKALADAAKQLIKENDNRGEAHYFAAALNNRLKNHSRGRDSFERALKVDAADHDMYVEQGNEAISLANVTGITTADKDFQLEYARAMYDLALKCRETSSQALSGVSIVLMYQKKYDDALSFAIASTKSAPNYAGAFYTLAAAQSYKRIDARGALATASKLDVKNLAGRSMPDALTVFRYFNTTGRTPVISTPARG
jgi:hypothetical protein